LITLIPRLFSALIIFFIFLHPGKVLAQHNLLLNGGFEDINTCTEYNAECGVEAWFYLLEVKAQMQTNETDLALLGYNSLAVSYKWQGYEGLSPVIGTILPCRLQKDSTYIFSGIFSATLNAILILKPGVAMGEKFYVPQRPFSAQMQPATIIDIKPIPKTNFFRFEYSFIATGTEKYLTFGTFISKDTTSKIKLRGIPIITLTMDDFELRSANNKEVVCNDFETNKKKIYNYNFRHRDMDNNLFTKGELPIDLSKTDSNNLTRHEIPKKIIKPDTLNLGELFFDFNKANLKKEGITLLEKFFNPGGMSQTIDSIYIEGHTDSIGTDAKNFKLSFERSKSVQSWLILNNILSPEQIQIHSFGKTRPVATNSTSKGRALNRRVEIIVFRRSEQ
jgi:outer membrane protein OmpA-like peptidoglycan-associated protein